MRRFGIDVGSPDSVRRIARAAGAFSIAVGSVVLFGWLFDVPPARDLLSPTNPMRPITATMLGITGLSIWLLAGSEAGRRAYVAGRVAGVVVAAAGLGTIFEYATGIDVSIDFLVGTAGTLPFPDPGRMSPLTALAFLLLGGGLAIIDVWPRWAVWPAGLLAAASSIVAYVGILGFAFDVEELRSLGAATPIAAPTAVTLFVASAGFISARPDRGLARLFGGPTAGSLMARRVVPASLVILPIAAFLRLDGERAGLYSPLTGVILLTVVIALALVTLMAWTGRTIDRADAERQEASTRLDRFFTLTGEMLAIIDAGGRFRSVNDASRRVIGREPGDLVGVPSLDLVHPDDRDRTRAEFRRLIAEGHSTVRFQNRFLLPDGSVHWLEWSAVSDAVQGVVDAAARDVTERLASEAAIRAAREEAEAANRAKTEFLSRMSHEFRTPLNAVIGFAQLLQLDDLEPAQREAVGHVLTGGRHLLNLINDVLDISHIEAGQMRITTEPIAISEAMDEAVAMVAPMAAARGIEIRTAGVAGSEVVLADRQRLTQVLLNLLSNAIKYNRQGGHVTLETAAHDGDLIRVAISDEGPGVDPAMHDRLFRPFDRLGAEATVIEGTGLGLTLTKALVEQMGGSIGLAPRPDGEVGTTFWFELPAAADEQAAAVTTPATAAVEPLAARGGLVLHIEDDPSNLHLIERAMDRRPGVRLIPAMLGGLGVELARQHHPDLILLDLYLPDLDGEAVLARLRADPATRGIPVVILSSEASAGHATRLMEAGAQAYLPKPVDLRELFALVDGAIGVKSVGGLGSAGS